VKQKVGGAHSVKAGPVASVGSAGPARGLNEKHRRDLKESGISPRHGRMGGVLLGLC